MANDSMNKIYVKLHQEEMLRGAQQRRLIDQARAAQRHAVPFYTRLARRLWRWLERVWSSGGADQAELNRSRRGKPLTQAITPVPVLPGQAGKASFSDERKPHGKGAGQ